MTQWDEIIKKKMYPFDISMDHRVRLEIVQVYKTRSSLRNLQERGRPWSYIRRNITHQPQFVRPRIILQIRPNVTIDVIWAHETRVIRLIEVKRDTKERGDVRML